MKNLKESFINTYDPIKKNKIVCICIFAFSVLYMCIFCLLQNGTLYVSSPDGDLYLNIADNFIGSLNFIQSIRPHEVNMVVPFGLPAIFLFFKIIVNSVYFIVFNQYIIFGLTCVLLYLIAKKLFNKFAIISPLIYLFTITTYYLTSIPAYTTTETYYLFLLVLFISFLFLEKITETKKLFYINIILFAAYIIRPVLSVLFFPSIFYTLFCILKKKVDFKKTLSYLMAFVIILSLNVLVNYKEAGHFVLMENYSGVSIYLANNENTKTSEYSSKKLNYFGDERFFEIYENKEIDNHEKNIIFKKESKKYMLTNIKKTFLNFAQKYKNLFLNNNLKIGFVISIMVIIINLFIKKNTKKQLLIILASLLSLTIVTSLGLFIPRYSIIALPYISIFLPGFFALIYNYYYYRKEKL